MTIGFATEYIPRRMKELGIKDYFLRFRHFVLQAGEKIELDANNQFYFLVDEVSNISISSDFGFYDLTHLNTNEQCYEHQGSISITNYSLSNTHIKFIQVITKH